jgi:H+-transporting ATPase
MLYLKISLSDFLTVFAARTRGTFYSRKPGALLFTAACFAMFTSTMLALHWPLQVGSPHLAQGASWEGGQRKLRD